MSQSQPVPVEPDAVATFRQTYHAAYPMKGVVEYIDCLKSALQRAQEERDACLTTSDAQLVASYKRRAEQAEATNRRMVELLKEPSANMKSAGYGKPDYLAIFKAMSAELLKEVEK